MTKLTRAERHIENLVDWYGDYTAEQFDAEPELHYEHVIDEWVALGYIDLVCKCEAKTLLFAGCRCGFLRKLPTER